MFKNFFIFILIGLFQFGCAKKEKVKTSFKLNTQDIYRAMSAGGGSLKMVVMGESTDGYVFSQVMSSESVEVELLSGTWNFYVLAWVQSDVNDNVNNDFEPSSKIECALQENVNIQNSETTDVNLTLDNETCKQIASNDYGFQEYFRDSNNEVVFNKIKFLFCNEEGFEDVITSGAQSCDNGFYSQEEGEPSVLSMKKGYTRSYKVFIKSVDNFISLNKENIRNNLTLSSGCIPVSSTSEAAPIIFPPIVSDFKTWGLDIVQYFQDDCSGPSRRMGNHKVDEFLTAILSDLADPEEDTTILAIESALRDVCSAPAPMNSNGYILASAGNGTQDFPAVLCSQYPDDSSVIIGDGSINDPWYYYKADGGHCDYSESEDPFILSGNIKYCLHTSFQVPPGP